MNNDELKRRFATLTTPHVADGCIRAGVEVRCAPSGVRALRPGMRLSGRVLPTRHAGSVDVFLEALESAEPGDVLLADNGNRQDESCIGDLMALECQAAGLDGIVIWGLHRDSVEILEIGIPLFSTGSLPTGPQRADERAPDALTAATVGDWQLTRDDLVLGDDDGVLFIPADRAADILSHAEAIRDTETTQAVRIRGGVSLREQVHFAEFLARRETEPELTLREHLRTVGGAIEV